MDPTESKISANEDAVFDQSLCNDLNKILAPSEALAIKDIPNNATPPKVPQNVGQGLAAKQDLSSHQVLDISIAAEEEVTPTKNSERIN